MGKPEASDIEDQIRQRLTLDGQIPTAELVKTLAERVPHIGEDFATTLAVQTLGVPREVANDTGPPGSFQMAPIRVTPEAKDRYQLSSPDGESGSELGRGGMGRVLLCQDTHVARQVALKELLAAPDGHSPTRSEELRLLKEARICGQLEHPNIVPVYEVGRREDGRLYYTMKVIRGRTLNSAIGEAKNTSERLALLGHFSGLCQAIAYAHSQGVVHRDIKPENVMIGEFGETVVLDWGAARPRQELKDEARGSTEGSEGFLATPLYMSPEQALGSPEAADERSDVWSLGVVLYQLLCGNPPFIAPTLLQLIEQIVTGKYEPVASVAPDVPKELASVVERALQVKRDQRYPEARAMMRDIDAFRSGGRVAAYSYSSMELLRKFIERHRAAVLVFCAGVVLLIATLSVAYLRVALARDRALVAERLATENEQRAVENAAEATRNLAEVFSAQAARALSLGDQVAALVFAAKALSLEERADARGVLLSASGAPHWLPLSATERSTLDPESTSGSGTRFRARQLSPQVLAISEGEKKPWILRWKQPISSFSISGATLAVGGRYGKLVVYDLHDETPPKDGGRELPGHAGTVTSISHSRSGLYLATTSSDRTIRLWDLRRPDGRNQQVVSTDQAHATAFSRDGAYLAYATDQQLVGIYDLRARRTVYFVRGAGPDVKTMIFDEQGRLQTVNKAGRAHSFRLEQSFSPRLIARSNLLVAAFEPGHARVLAAGIGRHGVCLYRMLDGKCETRLPVKAEMVRSLAISDDGKSVALGGSAGFAMLWDLQSRLPQAILTGHEKDVRGMAFDAQSKMLESVGFDATLRRWDPASGALLKVTALPAPAYSMASLGRAPGVAVGLADGQIAIYQDGEQVQRWAAHTDWVLGLSASADGQWLASAGADGAVRLWPLPREKHAAETNRTLYSGPDLMLTVALSTDAKIVAAAGEDNLVRLFETQTGRLLALLPEHSAAVRSVRFSADDAWLLSASDDRSARVWSMAALFAPGDALLQETLVAHQLRLDGTQLKSR